MPTYHITKYALTNGITQIEGTITYRDKRILMQTVDGKGINSYYYPGEWWEDKEQAIKAAEKMLEKMEFK